MLPSDPILGMPSASAIDFNTYLNQHDLIDLSYKFIQMVDSVCVEKFGKSFSELNQTQMIQAISACKLIDVKLYSTMVSNLLKAYYTSPTILAKIGSGSVPPFPAGNSIASDDWSILESVYARGQIFRDPSQFQTRT